MLFRLFFWYEFTLIQESVQIFFVSEAFSDLNHIEDQLKPGLLSVLPPGLQEFIMKECREEARLIEKLICEATYV